MEQMLSTGDYVTDGEVYVSATESPVSLNIGDVFASLSAWKIYAWGAPPIILLGTVGNVLSAVVMNRKSLRASTTSLYLTVLAVCDLFLLYIGLVPLWLQQQFGVERGSIRNSGCTVFWFLLYFAVHFESWILVSVSLERFTAVWFPTKHKVIFTKRNALVGLAVTMTLLVMESSHFFYSFTSDVCNYVEKFLDLHFFIYPWIDLSLATLLPVLIMLLTSGAIIGKLVHLQKKTGSSKISSMTTILLSVTLTFFLLTCPICVYLILVPILMEKDTTNPEKLNAYVEWWAIVNLLYYLNCAVNFELYCLTGRRFRQELRNLLGLRHRVGDMESSQSNQTGVTVTT